MTRIESNQVLDRLPDHLRQYVLPQDYQRYTDENQATWRYVMRQNVNFLRQVAHESYLNGLKLTGISIDEIPSMYGMNRILKDIGWAAVAVDGLIPTEAFLEFQAYNVLVIAADIRMLSNIEYTPTPDIIHESAGHAPIIANPEYAEYLRRIGEIGSKAISSHAETVLFEAVRKLAGLKERPDANATQISDAQAEVDRLQAEMGEPSEMSRIKNLHWWTVEYGLIGSLENPKIYGAGLLSSIGESKWCMSDQVEKLPYDLSAAYQSFDVTRPQPQLYVTPDFAHLSYVLNQYANEMSLRTGGLRSLERLIRSQKLGTVELSTGLQISGVFDQVIEDKGKVAYLHCHGDAALAFRDCELIGHGITTYQAGFGSPIGKLKDINLAIEDMSPRDLEAYDIYEGREISLEFEGGVVVSGKVITGTRNRFGKIILVTFSNCVVRYNDQVMFEPHQGLYHMAVGKNILSAYAGPADLKSFNLITHKLSSTDHPRAAQGGLQSCYAMIRSMRGEEKVNADRINQLVTRVKDSYADQWLLLLELFELVDLHGHSNREEVLHLLRDLAKSEDEISHLVENGLQALHEEKTLTT